MRARFSEYIVFIWNSKKHWLTLTFRKVYVNSGSGYSMISPHSNNKEVIKRNNIISNEIYGYYNIHQLQYVQYAFICYCFVLCIIVIMHNQLWGHITTWIRHCTHIMHNRSTTVAHLWIHFLQSVRLQVNTYPFEFVWVISLKVDPHTLWWEKTIKWKSEKVNWWYICLSITDLE